MVWVSIFTRTLSLVRRHVAGRVYLILVARKRWQVTDVIG